VKAINATPIEAIEITEGSRYYTVTTYTIDDVAQDISGGSFKMNLLDEEGGTILDTVTVDYLTDGTDGQYAETFTISEIDALITAGTIPTYYEFFFSSDGTDALYEIWYKGPVVFSYTGD
jgi:hypothetical protein